MATKGLMRAGDVPGLPVVCIDSGEDIAEIRDVIYDGAQHELRGFTLNKRGLLSGRLKQVLRIANCSAIGPDAVMIHTAGDLSSAEEAGDDVSTKTAVQVVGNRVVSANGSDLGEIVGVVIETDGLPSAVGYEVKKAASKETAFVPISEQMTISGKNLLVPAELEPFITNDLAGFGASVATYRAGQLRGEQL